MRTSLVTAALLATTLACAPFAMASNAPAQQHTKSGSTHQQWHGKHHARGHMHRRGNRILKQLDLTDSQRTSIRQWSQQDFTKARAERRTLRSKAKALRNATPGTSAYQNAAKALAAAEGKATSARVLRRTTRRAKIYKLLTPAQRTKLADLRAQRKSRMQKWRKAHAHRAMPARASSSAMH